MKFYLLTIFFGKIVSFFITGPAELKKIIEIEIQNIRKLGLVIKIIEKI